MRSLRRLRLPTSLPVVAGALLLAVCGTGCTGAPPEPPPLCGPGATEADGEVPSGGAAEASARPAEDGVTVLGTGRTGTPCAVYQVTGDPRQDVTHVVTLDFLSAGGRTLTTVEDTVRVAPGRTLRRTVTAEGLPPDAAAGGRARLVKARSFPTAEAWSKGGTCPPSGLRVYADEGDAAMGLRVVGLHLENCGTRPYPLHGYPRVEIQDEEHRRVDSVRLLQGGDAVAGGTGADGPALPMVLAPGERAVSALVWRNTVEGGMGDPVNAPYARIWAKSGAGPVTVLPELDLGTTGKLAVGPWKKDDTR
ncbi:MULTISPECIES: DUF4232 domain-containing protein [unclassified Streptomyces]|uniref:DUF4232 domain-containing protein n=1 Tax=unclassified Streptomyces TaxID=2593676 RepID=UPI00166029EC|nr:MULTISPECIES: DUF4232 domain-containing protein [unclassified Streptomyces]MBD0709040.1 hypothetical protein [Streptomyces sp. CBMA291]MBD0715388.1 hypothetical protein [Streptomyces sp. CBMA370]